jgi:hypothetical protein
MLIDMAHDEFHDPGDVAARVTLGESDLVELLLRERPHERAEVLRGHFEEAQRLVSRWQAEPSASPPVELVRDLPVERERLLADKHLLDPTARADDALTNVVGNVPDRPALPAAGQSPLCDRQRLQQPVERREALLELVGERCRAIAHGHDPSARSSVLITAFLTFANVVIRGPAALHRLTVMFAGRPRPVYHANNWATFLSFLATASGLPGSALPAEASWRTRRGTFGARPLQRSGEGVTQRAPEKSLTNDRVPTSVYRPFCDDNVLVLVALTS